MLFQGLLLLPLTIFILFFVVAAPLFPSEEAKRVSAHCTVRDFDSACKEGALFVSKNPHDHDLWQAYLFALAESGDEERTLLAYRDYSSYFTGDKERRLALETVSWGVIKKAARSPQPLVRLMALLGSFHTQDARGVAILLKGLSDTNVPLRACAVQLSASLHDEKLQGKMRTFLHTEHNPEIRRAVIEALGSMGVKEAKEELLQIAKSATARAEEKGSALVSLAALFKHISKEELIRLQQSDRAALRELACRLVISLDQTSELALIVALVDDPHTEVKLAALHTLGLASFNNQFWLEKIVTRLNDPSKEVRCMAAWALMRHGDMRGSLGFYQLMRTKNVEERLFVAGALVTLGPFGVELMKTFLREEPDLFVRMNLAIGLLGQREEVEKALAILAEGLQNNQERWMWKEEGPFRTLAKSDLVHTAAIPQFPEAMNQVTRLEVINILALFNYPKTSDAMKGFLKGRVFGVSGMAAALLLTEGDESALAIVEELLKDPEPHIKVQAALVLALWGRGEAALSTLESCYMSQTHEIKERILEGMGRIGDASSIPFLTDRLGESRATLRVLAAQSLIQCLYH